MKLTRIVALAIIATSAAVSVQTSALQAQSLRSASPPAQFPPASFKGKQFVDSRGCVYIRAGIDGNVNWVPRVARNRKQLCGYKPTAVAGTTARPTQSAAPEQITLDGSGSSAAIPAPQKPAAAVKAPKPRRTTAAASAPAAAAPPVVTTARVRRTPQTTSARVTPAAPKPRSTPAAAPVKIQTARPAPAPQPRVDVPSPAGQASGGCAGASAISQQYSGQTGVRCGPQTKSPVSYGNGSGIGPQSSLRLTPNTRVLPVHVYQQQRHSHDLATPAGYKPAWADDRLNLRRAERDLRPAILTSQTEVPAGYVHVERGDHRMNPMRGMRTAEGDAQMAQLWSDTTPRRLRKLPLDRQVVTSTYQRGDDFEGDTHQPLALRLSSRSAPGAALEAPKRRASRYVRAATFADEAAAQQAAQALAQSGMPVRLGSVSRKGLPHKVVLAGPFASDSAARQALAQVQAAGYRGARISR